MLTGVNNLRRFRALEGAVERRFAAAALFACKPTTRHE
jgi:hypothetical protein